MPTDLSSSDKLAFFSDIIFMDGLSEEGIHELLAFAADLVRENKHLRSQIETDTAYRNELEVEKFSLQLELHDKEHKNG